MKNKNIIIILSILVFFLIIAIVPCWKVSKMKKENILSSITFNGLKIGDYATEGMLKNLVMDMSYTYEHNNIGFNIDENKKIYSMYFLTMEDSKGNVIKGSEDIEIRYKDKQLRTLEDFKSQLGEGKIAYNDELYYTITYEEDNIQLEITVKENAVINVQIRQYK